MMDKLLNHLAQSNNYGKFKIQLFINIFHGVYPNENLYK